MRLLAALRSLSWGGASPCDELTQLRAERIVEANLGELQDPLKEVEEPVSRTRLQNAIAVSNCHVHATTSYSLRKGGALWAPGMGSRMPTPTMVSNHSHSC